MNYNLEGLKNRINYVEELQKLEIEFQLYGYNQSSIQNIENSNGAKTAKEKCENLLDEKEYWNEV